jgi:error-prone DNA polymerase
VMAAAMLSVRGRVQSESGTIHIIADHITDLTGLLREIGDIDLPRLTMPGDGATHGGTIDPRERRIVGRDLEPVIPIRSHDFH